MFIFSEKFKVTILRTRGIQINRHVSLKTSISAKNHYDTISFDHEDSKSVFTGTQSQIQF